MTTNTIILIAVGAVVAILVIARSRWWPAADAPNTIASKPPTSAARPKSNPIRSGNERRSPTRRRPRPAPRKPKLTPKQRTRPACNIRRRCVTADAATARDEVNQEFDRANAIDPDIDVDDTGRRRHRAHGRQAPPTTDAQGRVDLARPERQRRPDEDSTGRLGVTPCSTTPRPRRDRNRPEQHLRTIRPNRLCRQRSDARHHRLSRHPDRSGQWRRQLLINPGVLALAAQPGGTVALAIAALAFLVMALWRLVETAVGRSTDPKSQRAASEVLDRGKAFALAVVYFALRTRHSDSPASGKVQRRAELRGQRRLMQTTPARRLSPASSSSRWADITSTGEPVKLSRRPQRHIQRLGAATGHGGLRRQRPGHRRGRNTGHRRGHSYGAGQGDRNRRRPENTWGPTLRSSAADRRRPGHRRLRPVQLRHGPIQQNVSGSRGLNDVLGKVDRLRIVWSVHGYLPSDVSDIALVGRKC